MVTFKKSSDYLLEAKIGDKISILEDSPKFKQSIFKVVDIFRGKITVQPYYSRTRTVLDSDTPITLITKDEYKKLKS